jgi:hypothetical protein
MRRLAGALVLGWLTSGCVSLTPAQQRGADEVRAMADEVARVYGMRRISVVMGDNMEGVGGTYRHGLFTITTAMLTSRHRDSIVAHELAHYLLGHDRPLAGTLSLDWQREQELRELEANAKAVEVLVRVRRLSEQEALSVVYEHLLAFNRLVVARRTVIPWGHRAPCEEIADLLGRFPTHRAWSTGLECAGNDVGGPDMAPHAPRRSSRPGKAVRLERPAQVGSSGGGSDGASRANSLPGYVRRVYANSESTKAWA